MINLIIVGLISTLMLAGKNIGVIAGPLVAIIIVIATVIVALVVVLTCMRYRNSRKLSSGKYLYIHLLPLTMT